MSQFLERERERERATSPLPLRESNFELLRIVSMLIILLHHSVVHSGILYKVDADPYSINSFLLALISIGGKIGVNIFFMITGYFMVTQKVKISKILRFLLEIIFYKLIGILIYSIPQGSFSLPDLIRALLPIITDRGGFIDTWFFVFLIAPFTNTLCTNLSKRRFIALLGVLYFYFCINSLNNSDYMSSYFSWGITMYITGAFTRIHSPQISSPLLISSLIIGTIWLWGTSLIDSIVPQLQGTRMFYYTHANMLPYLLTSVSIFIIFKRIPTFHNRFINTIAGGAFGVYLLHDVAGSCRQTIWIDWVPIAHYFTSPYLIPMIILYCIAIYIAFASIDLIRSQYIERPLFNKLNHHIKWLSKGY